MCRLFLLLYLLRVLWAVRCYKGTFYRGTEIIDCPEGCYHYREDRLGFGRLSWDMWYQRVGCRDDKTQCEVETDPEGSFLRRATCCQTDLCNRIEVE